MNNEKIKNQIYNEYKDKYIYKYKYNENYMNKFYDMKEHRYRTDKREFLITKSYREYLNTKKKTELLNKIETLKSKLEYQKKTYNEIDEIDQSELKYLITEYYKI